MNSTRRNFHGDYLYKKRQLFISKSDYGGEINISVFILNEICGILSQNQSGFMRVKYPEYPSRMSCLYVSKTFEEAETYWKNEQISSDVPLVAEMLVDGTITVMEVIKEINANVD